MLLIKIYSNFSLYFIRMHLICTIIREITVKCTLSYVCMLGTILIMTARTALINAPVLELYDMPNGGGSDKNLKKDIRSIRSGLQQILALRPVSWRWKSAKSSKRLEHGFVAQEVEEILPELVYLDMWEDGTERKFLSTKEMIPYLVAAVQEQQKQIDALRKELGKKE